MHTLLAAFFVFALFALIPKDRAGMSRPRSNSLAQMETPLKRHARGHREREESGEVSEHEHMYPTPAPTGVFVNDAMIR